MSAEHNVNIGETKMGEGPVRLLLIADPEVVEKHNEMLISLTSKLPNIQLTSIDSHSLEDLKSYVLQQQAPFVTVIDLTKKGVNLGGHGVLFKTVIEQAMGKEQVANSIDIDDSFADWYSNHTNLPVIYLNPESETLTDNLHNLLTYFHGK